MRDARAEGMSELRGMVSAPSHIWDDPAAAPAATGDSWLALRAQRGSQQLFTLGEQLRVEVPHWCHATFCACAQSVQELHALLQSLLNTGTTTWDA